MYPNTKYQRLDNEQEESTPWLRITFRKFTLTTCGLPMFAFFFCIVYSLIKHFKRATATSCGAYNILPSISAAIGGFSPQREVWQTAISVDFLPRVILILIYTKYNLDVYKENSNILVYILALLNTIENCALMLLSYYDSTHNYGIHEISFITFVLTSQLHMLLLICQKSWKTLNNSERYGLKLKKLLAATNISGILLAMYYFIDHNQRCEDFAYSKFAFCEYVVVLSNIAFHFTIVYDFPYQSMVISPKYLVKLEDIRLAHRSLVMQA